eukprot:491026_1
MIKDNKGKIGIVEENKAQMTTLIFPDENSSKSQESKDAQAIFPLEETKHIITKNDRCNFHKQISIANIIIKFLQLIIINLPTVVPVIVVIFSVDILNWTINTLWLLIGLLIIIYVIYGLIWCSKYPFAMMAIFLLFDLVIFQAIRIFNIYSVLISLPWFIYVMNIPYIHDLLMFFFMVLALAYLFTVIYTQLYTIYVMMETYCWAEYFAKGTNHRLPLVSRVGAPRPDFMKYSPCQFTLKLLFWRFLCLIYITGMFLCGYMLIVYLGDKNIDSWLRSVFSDAINCKEEEGKNDICVIFMWILLVLAFLPILCCCFVCRNANYIKYFFLLFIYIIFFCYLFIPPMYINNNNENIFNYIFIVMSAGFMIIMCFLMCFWNMDCMSTNKGHVKDYTVESNKNAKFRAKLCRRDYRGQLDYNRAYSMWTFAQIYLIWWIVAAIIQSIYIYNKQIIMISFYTISIIVHCLCFYYGLYKCYPSWLLAELVISSSGIALNIFSMFWFGGFFHIVLIIVGIGTVYLYYFAWQWSKRLQPLDDNNNNNNNNIYEDGNNKIASVTVICGTMDVIENLKGGIECRAISSFPTLIANCKLSSGKWYYEIELINVIDGRGQFGWCTETQKCSSERRVGTGDTMKGWAYDGYNHIKCHDYMESLYGDPETWKNNDIIGCWLDLDHRTIRFSKNGHKFSFAFVNFNTYDINESISPSCSMKEEGCFRIHFNENQLKYQPEGYNAISKYFQDDFKFEDDKYQPEQIIEIEETDKYFVLTIKLPIIPNAGSNVIDIVSKCMNEFVNIRLQSDPLEITSIYHSDAAMNIDFQIFVCNNEQQRKYWYVIMNNQNEIIWRIITIIKNRFRINIRFDSVTLKADNRIQIGHRNNKNHINSTQIITNNNNKKKDKYGSFSTNVEKERNTNDEVDEKKCDNNRPKTLDNESIQFCIKLLTGALARRFNHCKFDINEYIYIHGGACRDAILNRGRGIKDIDLSVDLNKIHQHAISCCKREECVLYKQWYDYGQNAYELWDVVERSAFCKQMFEQAMKSERYKRTACFSNKDRVKNPEQCYDTELIIGSVLHEYVNSDVIINTKYLLKQILKDTTFKRYCKEIVGPKWKTIEVSTYTIFLENGVDVDIMDCSCFSSHQEAASIIQSRMHFAEMRTIAPIAPHVNSEKNKLEIEYEQRNAYPLTHKEHAKRCDCTFNALYIKLSSVVNINSTSEWYDYVIDPYRTMNRADADINAINDLHQGIVRPYRDAALWDSNDTRENSSLLGSIASNAKSGQAEFLIFRTLKNAYKLKDRPLPISISKRYSYVLKASYSQWFNVKHLMQEFVYNKKEEKDETKLERVLRHTLIHNYFRNGKIPLEYVIGIYHMLSYDSFLVECFKDQKFKKQVEIFFVQIEQSEKYNEEELLFAQKIWNAILKCGKQEEKRYYPIDSDTDTKLFVEYD